MGKRIFFSFMNRFILCLAFYSALISTVKAQSLKGIIIDKTDNTPLPGATVTLNRTIDSVAAFTAVTDKSGTFFF